MNHIDREQTMSEAAAKAAAEDLAKSGLARPIRKLHRLTLEQVAKVCGASVATVSRWERGIHSPQGPQGVAWSEFMRELADRPARKVQP